MNYPDIFTVNPLFNCNWDMMALLHHRLRGHIKRDLTKMIMSLAKHIQFVQRILYMAPSHGNRMVTYESQTRTDGRT